MKTIPTFHTFGMTLSLLFLCSCTTSQQSAVPAKELPGDIALNKEAGRGGLLYVTLRLTDGQELPFLLDTGSGGTAVNKSLEQKLGKRIGTGTATGWSGSSKVAMYAAPKLYLGNTPLITGSRVWGGGSAILGMDCLKHYCIQLDFAAGKMRFLKPGQVNTVELGKAYPLTFKGNLPFIHHVGLLGGSETNLLIDMGCRTDGLAGKNAVEGLAQFLPECVWDGEVYSNLFVAAVENANVLGLNFFARHLVTLDFPNRVMYLKQTSVNPLTGYSSMKASNDEIEAPAKFLESLREDNQLTGLSNNDQAAVCLENYSNFDSHPIDNKNAAYIRAYFSSRHKSSTFAFRKSDDSFVYHYTVARNSEDSPWKLQKAWRTDQNNGTIEEFSVP
jgi:hypothetical protein